MPQISDAQTPVTIVDHEQIPTEELAEVFSRHVQAGSGGMAFSVHRDGEPLVQMYGGTTERGGARPWTESTLAVLFSGTKGLVATLAAISIDRGELDPQARVADLWPEFAQAGKAEVRVHHVLSHTVGLVYVDPAPVGDEQLDNALMAERLAAQEPLWEPGDRVAYHAITYGYLMTEILRRVTGRSVGDLVRERLATPHGLDIHLGLPESEEPRVATIHRADGYRVSTFLKDDPERRRIVDRMYGSSLLGERLSVNEREHHAAELSAGGGIGSADAMSRLYSLIAGGESVISAATRELATRTWSEGTDAINDRPVRFGLGYELDDPIGTYGAVRPAFGHTGAGGGLHGAWPDHGIGFSFLLNEMQSEDVDRRAKDLLEALASAIEAR
ncbi:serine hydrolase domain-containing protein [Propioniferax innocua]|uniref:CubicO group peptidase (Beta-lactamase class C family) n=1 Tax=Propioniferax innocua TaxID=1753 RepID=A0A542ZSA7_9ACTN|nr:serine hydrolase domain-containing protein [Propioniferax innocua]TQL63176.1 CubicO group peptidase (beta-lactamase class C family) [Propioniferax innocua]